MLSPPFSLNCRHASTKRISRLAKSRKRKYSFSKRIHYSFAFLRITSFSKIVCQLSWQWFNVSTKEKYVLHKVTFLFFFAFISIDFIFFVFHTLSKFSTETHVSQYILFHSSIVQRTILRCHIQNCRENECKALKNATRETAINHRSTLSK